jgi:hypothetical protein
MTTSHYNDNQNATHQLCAQTVLRRHCLFHPWLLGRYFDCIIPGVQFDTVNYEPDKLWQEATTADFNCQAICLDRLEEEKLFKISFTIPGTSETRTFEIRMRTYPLCRTISCRYSNTQLQTQVQTPR